MGAIIDTSFAKNAAPLEWVTSSGSTSRAQAQNDGASSVTQPGALADAKASQTDRVTLSEDALRKAGLLKTEPKTGKTGAPAEKETAGAKKSSDSASTKETAELAKLKSRDREVRAHEQAHISAGGSLVRGGASFGYATGPDGRLYAVSGEVSIDSSPVQNDPTATVRKMSQVTRAALAPAQPSGQDRAVASAATKEQMDAQRQVMQAQVDKMQGSGKSTKSAKSGAPEASRTEKSAQVGAQVVKMTGDPAQVGAPAVNKTVDDAQTAANNLASHIFALGVSQSSPSKQPTPGTKHINLWA